MTKKMKRPSLVALANERLERVRDDLRFVFEVASIEGDPWAAATVTAAQRALGSGDPNNHLKVIKPVMTRKR